jgi:ABC-type taurine transport system ATPase subunit
MLPVLAEPPGGDHVLEADRNAAVAIRGDIDRIRSTVELAHRAFALEPALLLMDEPFAALDALTRRQMQDELLKLCEETGNTTLFVTHGIDEAIRVGTHV